MVGWLLTAEEGRREGGGLTQLTPHLEAAHGTRGRRTCCCAAFAAAAGHNRACVGVHEATSLSECVSGFHSESANGEGKPKRSQPRTNNAGTQNPLRDPQSSFQRRTSMQRLCRFQVASNPLILGQDRTLHRPANAADRKLLLREKGRGGVCPRRCCWTS